MSDCNPNSLTEYMMTKSLYLVVTTFLPGRNGWLEIGASHIPRVNHASLPTFSIAADNVWYKSAHGPDAQVFASSASHFLFEAHIVTTSFYFPFI